VGFYKSVFGEKLAINTFKEFQASEDSDDDDKILHSELEAENGIFLWLPILQVLWNIALFCSTFSSSKSSCAPEVFPAY
jgi:hypothetical protein